MIIKNDPNDPISKELNEMLDQMLNGKDGSEMKVTRPKRDYPLTAFEIWESWDRTTKIENLGLMINQTLDDIRDLELQLVLDDIRRKFLSKEELSNISTNRGKLNRKRGELSALKKKQDFLLNKKSQSDKKKKLGERPNYLRLIYSKGE